MKKQLMALSIIFNCMLGLSQGLEDIIVEKIPVTAEAVAADPTLPADAFAYRIFVDMAPGYGMQAVFSLASHEMFFATTTFFYNNIDGVAFGRTMPNGVFNDPAGRFDTYITVDGLTSSRVGIPLEEDITDGKADGYTTGTSLPLQTVGDDFEPPFGYENYTGKFSTFSGIYNVNGVESGTTSTNRVIIGQFTTNGEFSFEINIQIKNLTTNQGERYVAKNPTGSEILNPKLTYPSLGTPPVVTVTSPENNGVYPAGSVNIQANASDADGNISKVEFFVDDFKVGEDLTAPYQYNWTGTIGRHTIKAEATDNNDFKTSSAFVTISIINPPPTISLITPANGASFTEGSIINIGATATDADGSIIMVEFFLNGKKIGEDNSAPYQYEWPSIAGTATLTAIASDNGGEQTTSAPVTITVNETLEIPVSAINVSATGGATTVEMGSTLQMLAEVLPVNATNKNITWSVTNGTGQATISASGLLTPSAAGAVTTRATAADGSNTTGSAVITVTAVTPTEPPVVSVTNPLNNAQVKTGTSVNITANASDPDGTITKVEFFVNDNKIGEDLTAPYQVSWTAVAGQLIQIKAIATDNSNLKTTSSIIYFNVTDVVMPVVAITSPVSGVHLATGNQVPITATASDGDGAITLVEFFRSGVKIGEDATSPYELNWTAIKGTAYLTARATDNDGNKSNSKGVLINVNGNTGYPVVNITEPLSGIEVQAGSMLNITADAADSDGTIALIELFKDGVKISEGTTAPYQFNWASEAGTFNFTAKATDNEGKQSTSPAVLVTVKQDNIGNDTLVIDFSKAAITGPNIQIPVSVISDMDVTSFDFQMKYKPNRITFNNIVNHTPALTVESQFTPADSTLRVNASSQIPVANNTKLISASFGLLSGGVSDTDIKSASAHINGKKCAVKIVFMNTIPPVIPPTVSIISPANNAILNAGATINITALASDADGSITNVEFFKNGTKIGEDNTLPYECTWITVAGTFDLTARAVDNSGNQTTSTKVTITVQSSGGTNQPPVVAISKPLNTAEFVAGEVVTVKADATDPDGVIASVEFFVNDVKYSKDVTAPYEYNWISVPGVTRLTAVATDNKGAKVTSAVVSVNVNNPPSVKINMPTENSEFYEGQVIEIEAGATDTDGTITLVEFFVNGAKTGQDNSAPYSISWTAVEGEITISAMATDNKDAKTVSSPVKIKVNKPAYQIETLSHPCNENSFCMVIKANNAIDDVIGLDLVLLYDTLKVLPTGVFHLADNLINPSYTDYAVNINKKNSELRIALFLNPSAPEGTVFKGTGDLGCIEFEMTENFGATDSALFRGTALIESYYTGIALRDVKSASCYTYKDYRFWSELKYWKNDSPIAYDPENPDKFLATNIYGITGCDQRSEEFAQPDLSGKFGFNMLYGDTIEIVRDIKDETDMQSVINGSDALLVARTALGDKDFTPNVFQMLAMDVNMDGVVTSGDVSQVNQRSVRRIKEFKQSWNYNNKGIKVISKPSKDWLFVDSKTIGTNPQFKISSVFPDPDEKGYSKWNVPAVAQCHPVNLLDDSDCPVIEYEKYTGILLGDINGNYNDIPSDGKLKSTRAATNPALKSTMNNDKIVIDLANVTRYGTDSIDIPVYISASFVVHSFDFQLQFNKEKLVYDTSIIHSDIIALPNYYKDSIYQITAYSLDRIDQNVKLLSLRLKLPSGRFEKSDISYTEVRSMSDIAAVERLPEIEFTELPSGLETSEFENGLKVYPNPASDHICIVVPEIANIDIVDLNGKIVRSESYIEPGKVMIINTENLYRGFYILKIYNDINLSTKSIFFNN
ncbi:MAG: Ig-like domain-containing protein [Bacteroidales bacterium]|nr:Ig-like domain-containing protein [Bacteroidales bacterium]